MTRFLTGAALAALLALSGAACSGRNGGSRLAASGTVEATEALLGFAAGGRIHRIYVQEGDAAIKDSLLAVLDTTGQQARLEQARGQLAAARALLAELERGNRPEEIAQGRAALEAADKALQDARLDRERARRLAATNVVSRQALDKAEVAFDLAQSRYDQAHSQLELLESGPRRERISAQRSQVAAAAAQVEALEAGTRDMLIRAPFPGVISVKHHEPGETVAPGAPVLTLMNPEDRWVRIYVPENRLGAVRLGQGASIHSDTYPDRSFAGQVTYIAPDAEFTPRNVQTTEERVKLVYAVKVRITSDTAMVLKPGTPADVTLSTGEQ
ncbi:MAG: HlyD family secretion protein [Gemmatimonadales bacterium]